MDTVAHYTLVQWSDALVLSVSSYVAEIISNTLASIRTMSETFGELGQKNLILLDRRTSALPLLSNSNHVGVCALGLELLHHWSQQLFWLEEGKKGGEKFTGSLLFVTFCGDRLAQLRNLKPAECCWMSPWSEAPL